MKRKGAMKGDASRWFEDDLKTDRKMRVFGKIYIYIYDEGPAGP